MLADVLAACKDESPAWQDFAARAAFRAKRYAAVQERLIAPDGSFPAVGRSIAYRCGAFHLLAQAALRHALPDGISPAQVRGALTAVSRRSLEAPGTFDADGWLRIGFCGHQPGIGETYISTGSLYLCSVGLLPLGLPASDDFWSAPRSRGRRRRRGVERPSRSITRSDCRTTKTRSHEDNTKKNISSATLRSDPRTPQRHRGTEPQRKRSRVKAARSFASCSVRVFCVFFLLLRVFVSSWSPFFFEAAHGRNQLSLSVMAADGAFGSSTTL